jgi:protein tyrosine/serine phosphatase
VSGAAERLLPFEGIDNFRDYGGYRVARGGRLRRGLLFRSGQHAAATDGDLAQLEALGLEAVADLRGHSERVVAPCRRPAGFAARVYRVETETASLLAPHVEAASAAGPDFDAHAMMLAGYRAMPFRASLVPALAAFFEMLAEHAGPTLVHCAAGKDRTGFAVALLQAALGVHDDDVAGDYLLSNDGGDADARFARGVQLLRGTFGLRLPDAQLRMILSVRPEFLAAALAAIRERYASIPEYLEAHLGVTAARIEAIAVRLVA